MMFVPTGIDIGASLLVLVLLIIIALMRVKQRRGGQFLQIPLWLTYLFSFLIGIGMYPAISNYLSTIGAGLVLGALIITSVLFGSLAAYSYFSKRDFSFLGGILFFALLALILVSIVGMFFPDATMLHLALSWVGVIIFSGYVLYDISRMKSPNFTEKDVPGAVFSLFLNFINLFLDILRIISIFTSRD